MDQVESIVKTTIRLPNKVWTEIKLESLYTGVSLSDLITKAWGLYHESRTTSLVGIAKEGDDGPQEGVS